MSAPRGSPAPKRARAPAPAVKDEPMQDAAAPAPTAAPAAATAAALSRAGARVQDLMPAYYKHFFPVDDFVRWLAHGHDTGHPAADPSYLRRRELCYTLDGDIFVRYQSVACGADLARALASRAPSKIDVGPVYTADPSRRAAFAAAGGPGGFAPVERELVFDIDLTDYDDVRTCGSGGHVCARCWPLMAAAVAVLDAALRSDFGFKHLLWVFSGRRGVHCWVNDARARALTDEARAAVAAYLSIYRGVENGVPKLALPRDGGAPYHPSVDRALAALRERWAASILPSQRLLDTPDAAKPVLAALDAPDVAARLAARWAKAGPPPPADAGGVSVARWAELEAECAKAARAAGAGADARSAAARDARGALARAPDRAILACAYPRLDVDVSKKRNHLLKAPFCVHPKTGKVCVPFAPGDADGFDVDAVPTAASLLDARGAAAAAGEAVAGGWEGPLAPALAVFREGLLAPLAADARAGFAAKAAADARAGEGGRRAEGLAW